LVKNKEGYLDKDYEPRYGRSLGFARDDNRGETLKKRIDQIIVDNGLVESKNKAQALIMAGQVFVDDKLTSKAGTKVDDTADIRINELFPYVSRGALKLEKAYLEFNLDLTGKTICDIGSSTGGFTDFALQHGAARSYCIDVGTGQLAQKIREDPRVVVMEKTDFRDVGELPDIIDLFVCDVSFISLKKIIPKIKELASGSSEAILLIKPQFEAGVKEVSKGKGVIRDESLRQEIVDDIKKFATEQGFTVSGIVPSPITGAKGNVEFLLYLKNS
jgi:23S rRNA (cytidine1920-2'-O)/16S rRNA (cytidine1409-2'-O)-methyltransferase